MHHQTKYLECGMPIPPEVSRHHGCNTDPCAISRSSLTSCDVALQGLGWHPPMLNMKRYEANARNHPLFWEPCCDLWKKSYHRRASYSYHIPCSISTSRCTLTAATLQRIGFFSTLRVSVLLRSDILRSPFSTQIVVHLVASITRSAFTLRIMEYEYSALRLQSTAACVTNLYCCTDTGSEETCRFQYQAFDLRS